MYDPYDERVRPGIRGGTPPAPGRPGLPRALPPAGTPPTTQAPAAAPANAASGLPAWAHDQVMRGGGRPEDFTVQNGQLMKQLSPAQEKGVSEAFADHPSRQAAPIQPAGPVVPAPAAQGFAAALPAAQGPMNAQRADDPGQRTEPHDPVYSSMLAQHQDLVKNHPFYGTEQDIAGHRNAVMQSAMALQQYKLAKAQEGSLDPNKPIGLLRQIAGDPRLRSIYLAKETGNPEAVSRAMSPDRPVSVDSYEQAGQDPDLAGAYRILEDPNTQLHEKASSFASIPGIEDQQSRHRQLFDAYVNRLQSGNKWDEMVRGYSPGNPGQMATNTPGRALRGIFDAALGGLPGVESEAIARNRQFHQNMAKLGYAPASFGQ